MSDSLKWILLGAASIVFGVLALGNAVAASLAVTIVTGTLFVVAGGFQAFTGFREAGAWHKVASVGLGLLMVVLGVLFLANPFSGTISLALAVTALIAAFGIVRLVMAFQMESPMRWLMGLSGVVSVGLSIFIYANPQVTIVLLGILLGVELIVNGAALIALGLHQRGGDSDDHATA